VPWWRKGLGCWTYDQVVAGSTPGQGPGLQNFVKCTYKNFLYCCTVLYENVTRELRIVS